MINKLIHILLLTVFLISAISCNTSRMTNSSANMQEGDSKLNAVEKHDFDENFYNGIKFKQIDNDVNKAIGSFEKCVSIDNTNSGAMYELAKLYIQVRRYPEAQKLLESAARIDPQNKWYIMTLIEVYTQQSNYQDAITTLRKLADMDPYNIEIYYKLSDLYLMDRQPQKAIKVLDGVEQLSGILPEVSDRKKNIYMAMNKYDEAINEMKKLSDAYPYNTDYIKALIDMYMVYDKTDNLLPLYERILSIDSNDAKAQMLMAEYYKNTNNIALAQSYTEKVLVNPDLPVSNKINYLMLSYTKGKITPETKHLLLKYSDLLLDVYPSNFQVLAFKGDIYFNTSQSDSALIQYLLALEQDKSNYLIWKKVIMIFFEQRNYDKAIEKCEQATEYFPTNPEIYFYQGIALLQQDKYAEAVRIMETGKNYVANNKQLLQQFYANLGEAYHSLNENDNSDKYYAKALELDPNDVLVLNNFAYFLSLRKIRLDEAKKMSERSLQLDPDNPANMDTYGWILYLLKDYTEAEKQIFKALQKRPNDVDILEHYGDILYQLGQIDKAVEQWQKAKFNGSTSSNLNKKITDRKLYE